jgi:hypothetical protein
MACFLQGFKPFPMEVLLYWLRIMEKCVEFSQVQNMLKYLFEKRRFSNGVNYKEFTSLTWKEDL